MKYGAVESGDQLNRSCDKFFQMLQKVNEERNILQTVKRRKVYWIGHILSRNCILKHVIVGQIAGTI